jgi:hypothetical protein
MEESRFSALQREKMNVGGEIKRKSAHILKEACYLLQKQYLNIKSIQSKNQEIIN